MINFAEQGVLVVIAIISNALSAMAGGGAGLLQLPALIFLGLPFSVALATHKIATVALGAGATLKHARSGHAEHRFVWLMLVAGIPGVIVGAHTVLNVPEHIARVSLGVLTVGLGAYSIFNRELGQYHAPTHRDAVGYFWGALGLFGLGVLNGSLTSGTGLFVTIWLIRWFGFDFKRAVAHTLIMVGLFWNGTGALTLALQSPVEWAWLPALILGSLIGGYLGAHIAIKKGNAIIKRLFETMTILVGVALIVKQA